MNTAVYRHEYKYLISAAQMAVLRARAGAVMLTDAHVLTGGKYAGFYNIRSVYFDDEDNTCFLENENGTDPREKFRIRTYNHRDSKISLELKQKRHGKCLKSVCSLTRRQCELLIAGETLPDDVRYPPLLQKLLLQIRTRRLRPVVLVEYDRIPFIYPAGNVRVTFDCNLRTSPQYNSIFDEDIPLRSVLPSGQHILEIKWDDYIPDFIPRAMMTDGLQWCSFSKFYLCRKFCQFPTLDAYSKLTQSCYRECI